MSTVPNANKVQSLAAKLAARFKNAAPDQGFGSLGVWPNEPTSSDITADLTDLVVNWEGKFQYNAANKQRVTLPCLEVQPHYTWHEGPSGAMTFKGRSIQIPFDLPGNFPDNQRQRVEIGERHLKGQLTGLLGYEPTDLGAALTEATALIAAAKEQNTAVAVLLHLDIPTKNGKAEVMNKKDYIRGIASAPVVDTSGDSSDNSQT